MPNRRRQVHLVAAQCGIIALMCCGCCSRATESGTRAPVSAAKAPVADEHVARPLRIKTEAPCLRLEIAKLEEVECRRRGLCLQVSIRSVDCLEGIWVNTTSSFAVPGKTHGLFWLDVREADSGAPADVFCLIHPRVDEPTPEYVEFRGDTVVQRTISETCYQMSPTKSWRVVAHYKDNGRGPVTHERMQDWFTGELVSNEVLIPAKQEQTSTPK